MWIPITSDGTSPMARITVAGGGTGGPMPAIDSAEAGADRDCTGGAAQGWCAGPGGGIGNEYDVNVGVRRQ
jgi:hypothetical protein